MSTTHTHSHQVIVHVDAAEIVYKVGLLLAETKKRWSFSVMWLTRTVNIQRPWVERTWFTLYAWCERRDVNAWKYIFLDRVIHNDCVCVARPYCTEWAMHSSESCSIWFTRVARPLCQHFTGIFCIKLNSIHMRNGGGSNERGKTSSNVKWYFAAKNVGFTFWNQTRASAAGYYSIVAGTELTNYAYNTKHLQSNKHRQTIRFVYYSLHQESAAQPKRILSIYIRINEQIQLNVRGRLHLSCECLCVCVFDHQDITLESQSHDCSSRLCACAVLCVFARV